MFGVLAGFVLAYVVRASVDLDALQHNSDHQIADENLQQGISATSGDVRSQEA